jgi:sugar phosphate isomerase/epimerase
MTAPIQFGIATSVLREHPVSDALEGIARAGYAAAEIWVWHLERFDERPRDLARLARELDLQLTLHAPTADLNLTSTNLEIAQVSREQIARSLETAVALDAQVVTVHPGRKSAPRDDPEAVWARLVDWAVELDEAAAQLGVQVGLELMEDLPLEVFKTPADARRLMALPLQWTALTVDLAHLNTLGHPPTLLAELDPAWIAHVHLSDNAPHRVHLPLGDGEMDLGAVLEAVQGVYTGLVSLEGSIPGQGEALLARNLAYLRKLGY